MAAAGGVPLPRGVSPAHRIPCDQVPGMDPDAGFGFAGRRTCTGAVSVGRGGGRSIVVDEPGLCSGDELASLTEEPLRRRRAGSEDADGTAMDDLKTSNKPCFECVTRCKTDEVADSVECLKGCQDGPPPVCRVCEPGSSSEGGALTECAVCAAGECGVSQHLSYNCSAHPRAATGGSGRKWQHAPAPTVGRAA